MREDHTLSSHSHVYCRVSPKTKVLFAVWEASSDEQVVRVLSATTASIRYFHVYVFGVDMKLSGAEMWKRVEYSCAVIAVRRRWVVFRNNDGLDQIVG